MYARENIPKESASDERYDEGPSSAGPAGSGRLFAMTGTRPLFPPHVQFFTWLFVICLSLTPVGVWYKLVHPAGFSVRTWVVPLLGVGLVQLVFLYVQSRCSSESLTYWEGMHFVSYSMYGGTSYVAFFLITPALSVLLLLSVGFAIYGDIRRDRALPRRHFHRAVHFFYRKRFNQY